MIFNADLISKNRQLKTDYQKMVEEQKKKAKEYFEYINKDLDLFVNDPRHANYKYLLESLKSDYESKLKLIGKEENFLLEYGRIVGKIEVLQEIIDLPKEFKTTLGNIIKGDK